MKAWQLIEDPKNWCQNDYARDARGVGCNPSDPDAVCWCAYGALAHVYDDPVGRLYDSPNGEEVFGRLNHSHSVSGLIVCNDDYGHDVVISILKELDL